MKRLPGVPRNDGLRRELLLDWRAAGAMTRAGVCGRGNRIINREMSAFTRGHQGRVPRGQHEVEGHDNSAQQSPSSCGARHHREHRHVAAEAAIPRVALTSFILRFATHRLAWL